MSDGKKTDYVEKIFFIVGTTFLGMLFLFFKFGGIYIMKKGDNICLGAICFLGAAFLIVTAICLFCCGKNDNCCCGKFAECPTTADDWNKTYCIGNNNSDKKVPSDKSIIFIKDDADIAKIDFSDVTTEVKIFFENSKISLTTKQIQDLKNAKIFLDCGNSEIKITTENKSK